MASLIRLSGSLPGSSKNSMVGATSMVLLSVKYTKDELLTNIMIYWVTQTTNPSLRFYYEESHAPSLKTGQRVEVPVAMALFPKDTPAPRALAERTLRIECWTEMPRGGHFPAGGRPTGFLPFFAIARLRWPSTDTHRERKGLSPSLVCKMRGSL